MKLHQAIHAALGIGIALATVSTQTLFAATGDPLDGINPSLRDKSNSVSLLPDGTLDYGTCPSGYTCSSAPVSDSGFIQMMLTDNATGQQIIHTVIAEGDTGSTLANPSDQYYGSSSFVVMGGSGQASTFAGEQVINDLSDVETYSSRVANVSGDFASTVNPTLKINQDMSVEVGKYISGFQLTSGLNNLNEKGYDGKYTEVALTGSIVEDNGTFVSDMKLLQLTNSNVTTGQDQADADEYRMQRLTSSIDETGTVPDPFVQNFLYDRRTGAAVLDGGMAYSPTSNPVPFDQGGDIALVQVNESSQDTGAFTFEKFINMTSTATADYQSYDDNTDQIEVSYNDTTLGNPFEAF